MKLIKKVLLFMIISISLFNSIYAELELNYIEFDPAIVAAGDEVDIIVQFRDKSTSIEEEKIGNGDYTFEVELKTDDDISQKYISILDSQGDNLKGSILADSVYTKVFRVKVSQDAPAANYEFELLGKWYKNNVLLDGIRSLKFEMPVKKEGIILEYSNIISNPTQIRAGDNFVELTTSITNVGEKDAKSIEITFDYPQLIEPSYSNNNRVFIPRLNAGDSEDVTIFLNIDEDINSSNYFFNSNLNYLDLDNNNYSINKNLELFIKPRSYLEIEKYEGSGLAGGSGELKVWVKNTGDESAESVDLRIIKENSQPFVFDVRSSYIGELQPGEVGIAIFNFDILSSADLKEHDFKLQLRSTGDSDEGDSSVYTYSRRAKFEVNGIAPNYYLYIGSTLIIIFGLYLVLFRRKK